MGKLAEVNFNDLRKKSWHIALMLASAYAATNPKYSWAVPVLTGAAGVSAPPTGLTPKGAAGVVLLAAGLGLAVRLSV